MDNEGDKGLDMDDIGGTVPGYIYNVGDSSAWI